MRQIQIRVDSKLAGMKSKEELLVDLEEVEDRLPNSFWTKGELARMWTEEYKMKRLVTMWVRYEEEYGLSDV